MIKYIALASSIFCLSMLNFEENEKEQQVQNENWHNRFYFIVNFHGL